MASDTDALNRALAEKLGDEHGYDHWALPDGVHRTPKEFCYSLDAAVAALNALGFRWWYTGAGGWVIPSLSDGSYSINGQQPFTVSDRATPAALATALVQAALAVLKSEEETDA